MDSKKKNQGKKRKIIGVAQDPDVTSSGNNKGLLILSLTIVHDLVHHEKVMQNFNLVTCGGLCIVLYLFLFQLGL